MEKIEIYERLKPFEHERNIQLALSELKLTDDANLSNDEIHGLWHWVSKSLDVAFSDDDHHPMWAIESELAQAYNRT
ncbi:hypothetical protein PVK62_07855 [Aliivibrio sp. S3MY1]|uniref:hypothetical protein n=1 Tax=Aliivibrio TaxID=511678 RepID=UPI0018693C66|nr:MULTISPECIES: hypothetical protein [Aliivibrio]MDD9176037.1 hypothetical protein [Aliivibrio sp. S3TY1]MDD9193049.1 hypothetical protein [Aliivibrio sp. S2TY2]MDD9195752.1 hypothetical protein [Aliivibrio sp. S3MY1]